MCKHVINKTVVSKQVPLQYTAKYGKYLINKTVVLGQETMIYC